ncbi:MAG TPA: GNAT family N-acetyltransferase [Clostridiaceae bacterium]|nr:GNAT family N-acetyltransferase [Clostridiaceae bacterium]
MKMFFTELETERLLLRNIGKDDREFIYRHFSDETVTRYLYDEEPLTSIEEADQIIDFYLRPEPRTMHRWIMVRKSDGMKMGTLGFHIWDREAGRVEVGYDLREEFWGNGYMREAMEEIIRFAWGEMRVKEIVANISLDNEKSISLIENLSFAISGTKMELFRGKGYPHHVYSLYLPV